MKKVLAIVSCVLAGIALGAGPAAASPGRSGSAASTASVSSSPTSAFTSDLHVTFDKPAVGARSSIAPRATPMAAPNGAYLYCNKYYGFSDSDGIYHFQHACGGTTGPWGYNISSGLCAYAISDVTETGMAWTRNGVTQGRQAPHVEYCGYTFHGTYNPDRDDDHLTYSDHFSFRVDIGGDTGTATIDVHGSFTSAGCTSGKACGLAVR